jgi:hypothetical protein|tara:strand:- start:21 stop:920 length:900 start_codon:yes stop_codon:yes gene_type:complete
MSNNEDVVNEIEDEIKRAKGDPEDFQIEITDDPTEEVKDIVEEEKAASGDKEEDYGPKVQKRIKKLVDQRRQAEIQTQEIQEQNAQLSARLARLEQGSVKNNEKAFNQRYAQTRAALTKAVEEGDTEAQVNFQEQMADMRAAMRIAEMQKQQRSQQAASPTVGRAQQAATQEIPERASTWWQKNRWFNSNGYERETAAARSIDVQLDLEGYDKNSEEYYENLNNRLHKVFPELNSELSLNKARVKSRQPVAPTTGGSPSYKGNRVRMSQDQLRMARELGITDEAGLKKYESEIKRQQRS